ncbi:MAG: hypothetical protein ABIK78_06695 [candidate division WOR-3 bacterium]
MRNIRLILILILISVIILSVFYFWQRLKKEEIKIEYFPIYGADKKAEKEEINFYVPIPKKLPLIEKLKIIADRLSRFEFGGLLINVLKIEEKDNKKIAIVDLREFTSADSNNSFPSWRAGYFQGSTGGYFTSLTLIKSFLQEDYKGEWIDGIKFYYEGKPILEEEWEHIFLHKTIYRFEREY